MKGQNSVFALRLDDVSDVFDVEPKYIMGSSPVSIRIANGTLDYENPNQRKFIVLVRTTYLMPHQRENNNYILMTLFQFYCRLSLKKRKQQISFRQPQL